jgi:hypothetical protein
LDFPVDEMAGTLRDCCGYDSATANDTRIIKASNSSLVKGELDADWLAMIATHTSFSKDCMLGDAMSGIADSVIWLSDEGTDEAEWKRPFND